MKRLAVVLCVLLWGCTHAAPQLNQVFAQVNRVYDPEKQEWSSRLSVFVQASSADGTKVFDRLYLIHDADNLFFPLVKAQWAVADRPGEYWVGANGLGFAGQVPIGAWRVLLVTRSGQRMESSFAVPPQAPGLPAPNTAKVIVTPEEGKYRVTGWVEDYVVWPRDARGALLAQIKAVEPVFSIPAMARSFELYSYDKTRGEGLLAGPFLIQAEAGSADR